MQRADQVYLETGQSRSRFGLGLPLLHPVLAKQPLFGVVSLEQHLDRMHLAYGHQGDISGSAPSLVACFVHLGADAAQVFSN